MILEFLFTKTPLFFLTQSLWRDEAFSYFMTKESISNILLLSAKDFTPPLYVILLKVWIYLFGSSEIALRSLSLIGFILLVYFFFLFLTNILKIKGKVIYIYMLLFISNPVLHYYAFEARTYSLFILFSFMSFYYFLQKKWKNYFFSTVAGLYSHYFMILVLFCQIVFILINKKGVKKYFYQLIKPVVLFVPWIIFVLFNKNPLEETFWIKDVSVNLLAFLPVIIYTGFDKSLWYVKEIALKLNSLLLLLVLYGVFIKNKLSNKFINLIFIWSFLPSITIFLFSIYKPLFFPRYLIFSTPAIILLLIIIVENFSKNVKYVILLILFIFTINYSVIQIKFNHKASFKNVIAQIKSEAKKNDLLYVESELNYHVAKYYFLENKVFIFGKGYDEIPNFTGKVLIPKKSIVTTLPEYPSKAFTLHNDLTYDIQSLN